VGKRGIALESVEAFAEQQRAGRDGLDGLVRRRDRHALSRRPTRRPNLRWMQRGLHHTRFRSILAPPWRHLRRHKGMSRRRGEAGTPVDGIVLDPFGGSGTTALVANRLERNAILLEINPDYAKMAHRRLIDSGIEENSIFLC
jgi:hypothetical protein